MSSKLPPQRTYRVMVEAEGKPSQTYVVRGYVPGDAELEATGRYADAHQVELFDPPMKVAVEEISAERPPSPLDFPKAEGLHSVK